MKLRDLNPVWQALYRDFTPETGGVPTGDWSLSFFCPKCGAPRRVVINVGLGAPDEPARRWQINCAPDGPDWPDKLTVAPSIRAPSTHGREDRSCGWHGSIVNGELFNS